MSSDLPRPRFRRTPRPIRDGSAPPVRLPPSAILFAEGEPRQGTFVLEMGLIGFAREGAGAQRSDVALPGEIVGHGFLARHVETARALTESAIRPLDDDEMAQLASRDARARAGLDKAAGRELEAIRAPATAQAPLVVRLAALLVVLSRLNAIEGRDPALIVDEIKGDWIAAQLDTSIGELAQLLKLLAQRRLVMADVSGGLRIVDHESLERLSQG